MKKIFTAMLGLCVCGYVHASTTALQLEREHVAKYLKGLITSSCEKAVNGESVDNTIADATIGMKKDLKNDTYTLVYNSIVFGSRGGQALKEGLRKTPDGNQVTSCSKLGDYAMSKAGDEFIKDFLSVPQQAAIALSNASTYRTTAKSLATLYDENEVAADDKIGGRKVEVTGSIQEIRKDFKNDVVIELQTDNHFIPVRLSMSNGERAKAAKLRKGQKTVITCDRMMLLIGSPSGSNCTIN